MTIRDPLPGEIALAVSQQAELYATEYGWNNEYEALAMEIAAKFVREFKPGRERCWIAELDGEVVGAVFLVQVDDAPRNCACCMSNRMRADWASVGDWSTNASHSRGAPVIANWCCGPTMS